MKFIFTLLLLLVFSTSFSQWTRVEKLPASDIFTLYRHDSTLYAGGNDIIYISKDKGQSWDSTSLIPFVTLVDAVILYKSELYAASYGKGVYKSSNDGRTWQNNGNGILPFVVEFCEWRGNLYAATQGGGVFKLDSVGRDRWIPFNNGLSSLSVNLNSIAGNDHALIAGTLANGLYDHYSDNSTAWDEQFILNQLDPGQGTYDIITAHDSLFLAGYRGFYLSTDNGITWNKIGNTLFSDYTNLVNAKQALLAARNTFDGATNNTSFYYLKKDSLEKSFVPFSAVTDHFTYRMQILGNKLWDASSNGLYYMSLADLPGITPADVKDSVVVSVPPPPPPTNYPFTIGKLYPNPVAGEGHIALSFDIPREVSASIYDATGKLVSVLADHQLQPAGNTILSFPTGHLGGGIYFLRLFIDNQVFVREIIHTI
ncbi:MAG: T9SS type A sorting domain-containing protein [Bacteroidota bacterium]|nr:T9SS type A sorting domain-containing protein [Bacteroidota bacterium]